VVLVGCDEDNQRLQRQTREMGKQLKTALHGHLDIQKHHVWLEACDRR
jgi:hypothetical protein